jgi:hypothetical protein
MKSGDKEMANQEDQLVKLVAKLLELTQESKLSWKIVRNDYTKEPGGTKIIGGIFESKYKEKVLRIFKREYDNTEENQLFNLYMAQPSYSIVVELGFADSEGNIIWQFPRVSGIVDLYKAVAFKVAGVESFLKDILTEEDI